MLLGLSSSENSDELVGEFDLDVVTEVGVGSGDSRDGGVAHGALLARYAEQVHGGDDLDAVRAEVLEAVGPAGLVDAAAICANFNMMVRIADGTGTPLDIGTVAVSSDLRSELSLDGLTSRRLATS